MPAFIAVTTASGSGPARRDRPRRRSARSSCTRASARTRSLRLAVNSALLLFGVNGVEQRSGAGGREGGRGERATRKVCQQEDFAQQRHDHGAGCELTPASSTLATDSQPVQPTMCMFMYMQPTTNRSHSHTLTLLRHGTRHTGNTTTCLLKCAWLFFFPTCTSHIGGTTRKQQRTTAHNNSLCCCVSLLQLFECLPLAQHLLLLAPQR